MSNSSLVPLFDLEIPGIAGTAWVEVVRRAVTRAGEITPQRTNYEKITDQYHDDWQLLHRFEYDHFYSAWVGVAFRLRACAIHSEDFTTVFQRTRGTAQGEDVYQEDDALFGFFVKGLSALESFYYSLYALGALIVTSTQEPSVPPSAQFPLLTHLVDPAHRQVSPRSITPETTHDAYAQVFPGLPMTELLGYPQYISASRSNCRTHYPVRFTQFLIKCATSLCETVGHGSPPGCNDNGFPLYMVERNY